MRFRAPSLPFEVSLRDQLGRLSLVHALHSGAETMFAISLAGSLFFSVSLDAARPRILLYLALTLAPFAILAPLIGPVIDRIGGGYRIVLFITLLGRAALAGLLAGRELSLWLYPLAFGVLVLGKTYSIARNSLVPSIASGPHELVRANSQLAVIGTVGGALAAVAGAVLLETAGSTVVLWVAMAPYAAAAFAVLAITKVPAPATAPVAPAAEMEAIEEYIELASPAIRSAGIAMSALRAAVGFVTFHLGFALKSSGEPLWVFGLVLVANGLGGILGTLASPALRKRISEYRMLTIALTIPAVVAFIAALRFHPVSVVLVTLGLGSAVAIGRRAFDNVVQERAPHGARGAAYAGLETRLELGWVTGALAAVLARAPGWLGLLALAAALTAMALSRLSRTRWQTKVTSLIGRSPLSRRLLVTAERLESAGETRQAVIVAAAAMEAALEEDAPGGVSAGNVDETLQFVATMRERAVAGEVVDFAEVRAVVEGVLGSGHSAPGDP